MLEKKNLSFNYFKYAVCGAIVDFVIELLKNQYKNILSTVCTHFLELRLRGCAVVDADHSDALLLVSLVLVVGLASGAAGGFLLLLRTREPLLRRRPGRRRRRDQRRTVAPKINKTPHQSSIVFRKQSDLIK